MNPKRVVLTAAAILCGAISMFVFNYFFLEKIIIPDPCHYHNHEPSSFMKLFYEFTIAENYHPFPSTFNLIITLSVGALLGFVFAKLMFRVFPSRFSTVIDNE